MKIHGVEIREDEKHEFSYFLLKNGTDFNHASTKLLEILLKEFREENLTGDSIKIDTLNKIIEEIKNVNESRFDGSTISQDETNEEILYILQKYDLEDDYDLLAKTFGTAGADKIREAEQGYY